jgi:hypothetical protein
METPMFSHENSKLQMIETAHVNERKQAFTNQHPVGDDVSLLHPLRSSASLMPLDTTASPTGAQERSRLACPSAWVLGLLRGCELLLLPWRRHHR